MVFGALSNIFRGGTTPRDAAETRRPSKKKSKKRKRRRRRRDGDAAERRVGRDGGDDEATRGHIREGSAGPDGDARDGGSPDDLDVAGEDARVEVANGGGSAVHIDYEGHDYEEHEDINDEHEDDEEDEHEDEEDEEEDEEEEEEEEGIPLEEFAAMRVEETVRARRRALEGELLGALAALGDGFKDHQRAFCELLVRKFVAGTTGSVFQSDTGTGKTYTAMLIAAVFVRCRVAVVFATEKMLAKEARERFDRFSPSVDEASRFCVVVSGSHKEHGSLITDAMQAASEVSTDVVVIVDESSRYDGVHSVMNRALGDSTAFRVAMTATPIAASLDELVGAAVMVGLVGSEEKRRIAALTRAVVAAGERFIDAEMEDGDLTRFVNAITTGNRSLQRNFPRVADSLRRTIAERSRTSKKVVLAWIGDDESRAIDRALGEVETVDPDSAFPFAQINEVSSRLANARANANGDPILAILFNLVTDVNESVVGERVVVFVPSTIASLAWYAAAYIISRLRRPGSVKVVDQDTDCNERRAIVREFNSSHSDVQCLICTSSTTGFGIDMPTTTRAVFVTTSWVGSDFAQCLGRLLRIFNEGGTTVERDITILLVASTRGSLALARCVRAFARLKTFGTLFPSFIETDDIDALNVKCPLAKTHFTVQGRHEFETTFGDEVAAAFRDGDNATYEMPLTSFVTALNGITDAHDGLSSGSLKWLISRTQGHSHAGGRNAGGRNAGSRNGGSRNGEARGRGGRRRGDATTDDTVTSTGGLVYACLSGSRAREQAYIAVLLSSSGIGLIEMDPREARESRAIAARLRAGLDAAQRATSSGVTWKPSQSEQFGFFIRKNTDPSCAPRQFMVTASSVRPNKGFFNTPPRDNLWMAAGRENEAAAVRHVSAKYNLQLIDDIDAYSRVLPSDPSLFLATPDAMSECGVLIEVKFVHELLKELVKNGGTEKFKVYHDQVQGQLAVFGLHCALLSLYTIDGSTGRIGSYEFLIRRDARWIEDMLPKFRTAVNKQREASHYDEHLL